VGPYSSTWDRTCELYAQLTGTRTDYGVAHAAAHGHERFGHDYQTPLVPGWNSGKRKVNLLGYSFGGTTARFLAQLCEEGDAAERKATKENELSPLFSGILHGRVAAIVSLATPHNGSTVFEPKVKFQEFVKLSICGFTYFVNAVPLSDQIYPLRLEQFGISFQNFLRQPWTAGRLAWFFSQKCPERADYEMTIDGAAQLNTHIRCFPNIYYFSYTTVMTESDAKGNQVPRKDMWVLFRGVSRSMGRRRAPFTTSGGRLIDEKWLPNDGQINVISGLYPFNEPHQDYNPKALRPGVWQVMPTMDAFDHFDFAGGCKRLGGTPHIREFYRDIAEMLGKTTKK
jgi:triacylglycerol lipase